MKKVLFIGAVMLFSTVAVQAQENENQRAVKEQAKRGFFGHFDYRFDDIHTINVNYSITPRNPTDKINFNLHTPEPRPLSVAIVNQSGTKVREWNPIQDTYIKEGEIDIKSLPAGTYKFIILWDKKQAHEIIFEKK